MTASDRRVLSRKGQMPGALELQLFIRSQNGVDIPFLKARVPVGATDSPNLFLN
jgi:hypothetical protein